MKALKPLSNSTMIGAAEQFHSELKSDMVFERFPSGKMDVNAILLHIAMIAFNTLRKIGQMR